MGTGVSTEGGGRPHSSSSYIYATRQTAGPRDNTQKYSHSANNANSYANYNNQQSSVRQPDPYSLDYLDYQRKQKAQQGQGSSEDPAYPPKQRSSSYPKQAQVKRGSQDPAYPPQQLTASGGHQPHTNHNAQSQTGQPPPIGFIPSIMGGQTNAGSYNPNQPPPGQCLGGVYPPQVYDPNAQQDVQQDLSDEAIDMEEWNDKRDRIYMIILTAEEFLERLDEGDGRIRLLSQASETELHRDKIKELVSLRGHLQDELLRIEAMLAADDPELNCLKYFQRDHGRLVQVLRDLHEKQKVVANPEAISIALPGASVELPKPRSKLGRHLSRTRVKTHGVETEAGTSSTSIGVQSQGIHNEGQSVNVQRETIVEEEEEEQSIEVCEDDLKVKHDEEEKEVADKYSDKITGQKLSQEELEKLLNDHLFSMQALRNRQNNEKEKHAAILQRKRDQRLLKRKQMNDETDGGVGGGRGLLPPIGKSTSLSVVSTPPRKNSTGRSGGLAPISPRNGTGSNGQDSDSESEELSDEDGEHEEFNQRMDEELWSKFKGQVSEGQFRAAMEKVRHQQEAALSQKKQQKDQHNANLDAKLKSRMAKKGGYRDSLSDDDEVDSKESQVLQSTTDTGYHSVGESDSDTIQPKEIQEKDTDFIKQLRKHNKHLSDGEFEELLKRHLADVESIRRQKEHERGRHDDKLREKLAMRKQGAIGDYDSEDEFGDDGLVKPSAGTAESLSPQEEGELTELQESFKHKLLKQRDRLSEDDLQDLLNEYHERRQQLIKNKRSEHDRADEKMKQKLENRLKKRGNKKDDDSGTLTAQQKLATADEDFFQMLKQKQQEGSFNEDSFAEMLQDYVQQQKKHQRKMRKKKEKDDSKVREDASHLLQQYKDETKQIHDVRSKEKESTNIKLQQKLQAKKEMKMAKRRIAEETDSS